MQRMRASAHSEPTSDDASADYDVGYNQVPEEYQTADASVYQSVLDVDEGIGDDFQDDDNGSREGSTEWWIHGQRLLASGCDDIIWFRRPMRPAGWPGTVYMEHGMQCRFAFNINLATILGLSWHANWTGRT